MCFFDIQQLFRKNCKTKMAKIDYFTKNLSSPTFYEITTSKNVGGDRFLVISSYLEF